MFEEMALKQQLNVHNSIINYYSGLSFIERIAGNYGVSSNRSKDSG